MRQSMPVDTSIKVSYRAGVTALCYQGNDLDEEGQKARPINKMQEPASTRKRQWQKQIPPIDLK